MTLTALIRVYPICCTSAYCGETSEACTQCRNFHVIDEFNKWVKDHDAKVLDPIWSPLIYTATK